MIFFGQQIGNVFGGLRRRPAQPLHENQRRRRRRRFGDSSSFFFLQLDAERNFGVEMSPRDRQKRELVPKENVSGSRGKKQQRKKDGNAGEGSQPRALFTTKVVWPETPKVLSFCILNGICIFFSDCRDCQVEPAGSRRVDAQEEHGGVAAGAEPQPARRLQPAAAAAAAAAAVDAFLDHLVRYLDRYLVRYGVAVGRRRRRRRRRRRLLLLLLVFVARRLGRQFGSYRFRITSNFESR